MDLTVEPPIIVEIKDHMYALAGDITTVATLMQTDNLKFLTRVERDKIFSRLLENIGALEDGVKALVKEGRAVRRARLRDDDQLSRMVLALTEAGKVVDSFSTPIESVSPEVKAIYNPGQPATDSATE
jgi:hypothetical protein